MSDHPVAGRPVGELGIGLPVGVGEFKDPLALGGRQLVGGAAVEMQVQGSSGEAVEAVIRLDAAGARSATSASAVDGWGRVGGRRKGARSEAGRGGKEAEANTGWMARRKGGGGEKGGRGGRGER